MTCKLKDVRYRQEESLAIIKKNDARSTFRTTYMGPVAPMSVSDNNVSDNVSTNVGFPLYMVPAEITSSIFSIRLLNETVRKIIKQLHININSETFCSHALSFT